MVKSLFVAAAVAAAAAVVVVVVVVVAIEVVDSMKNSTCYDENVQSTVELESE